jgi:tetratricopeptide (TPR) repeat protein
MNNTSSKAWRVKVVALFFLGAGAVACASANKVALRQASAESAGSFASGDYGKALDSYKKLYEKDRANGKVVSGYAAMIEEVKAAGDEARGKGSFTSAQGAYRVVLEGWDGFSAIAPRLTFKKAELEAGIRDCRIALCDRQFRQELGAGNYAKAIMVYQAVLKDYPGDKMVKASCARGVSEIRAVGDKALAAKDYALAGKVNGLLLKNLESFGAAAGTTADGGLSKEELTEALHACSSGLTNGGLVEYRKGNLESAIALWDVLLEFDPGNAEIRKAVETAKAQLSKLKGSGRGSVRSGRSERGAH